MGKHKEKVTKETEGEDNKGKAKRRQGEKNTNARVSCTTQSTAIILSQVLQDDDTKAATPAHKAMNAARLAQDHLAGVTAKDPSQVTTEISQAFMTYHEKFQRQQRLQQKLARQKRKLQTMNTTNVNAGEGSSQGRKRKHTDGDNNDNDHDNSEEKKSLEFHSDHLPNDNVECLRIIDLMRDFGVDPDENDDADIGKEVLAVASVKFIPLYKTYVKDSLRLETLLEEQSVPLSEARVVHEEFRKANKCTNKNTMDSAVHEELLALYRRVQTFEEPRNETVVEYVNAARAMGRYAVEDANNFLDGIGVNETLFLMGKLFKAVFGLAWQLDRDTFRKE
ncbi:MAG: hypothetical protein M1836_004362 [Candelina mexicana]|nr:MAG: hypothetical protein M1836_004362 [Candelina mexicana]